MLRHPIAFGLSYGVVVHFVMQCIVITAVGDPPLATDISACMDAQWGYRPALFVGLPVALIAKWSATKNLQAKS